MSSHDCTYISPSAPTGWCKNRYCPDGAGPKGELVRGYCASCASIRLPSWKVEKHEIDYSNVKWGSAVGMLKYEYD